MDLESFYLNRKKLLFVIIDVQEALAAVMKPCVAQDVIRNIRLLVEVRNTVQPVREALDSVEPVEKVTFSSLKDETFMGKLSDQRLDQAVVMGMETHVCVFQTVLDLRSHGYVVHVPRDATCSRMKQNWITGLSLMEKAGALITSTETIAFQLLERADTDSFKALAPLLK
jgi:hypothetical protein